MRLPNLSPGVDRRSSSARPASSSPFVPSWRAVPARKVNHPTVVCTGTCNTQGGNTCNPGCICNNGKCEVR